MKRFFTTLFCPLDFLFAGVEISSYFVFYTNLFLQRHVILQSERFYAALKGNGALCRLVLLPLESHGYSGQESVMHCLWEMDRWLEKFCINAADDEKSQPNSNGNLVGAGKHA